MIYQQVLSYTTCGRSTTNITQQIQQLVQKSDIQTGTCHIFVQHTSASLMLCENADPDVRVI
ncbi:MAG: hypothetical protein COA83_00595 [Methylophaga sp.]|nr:MAG: hypothetical protein COA83_00595 [Methylophaga sp.]